MGKILRIFCLLSFFLMVGLNTVLGQGIITPPTKGVEPPPPPPPSPGSDSLYVEPNSIVSSCDTVIEHQIAFMPGAVEGNPAVVDILLKKTKGIIGRIGCGAEDAAYLIIPSLEVDEVRNTTGGMRTTYWAQGTLTLSAVSASNPDIVWHTATFPLKSALSKADEDPARALANKINIMDKSFVRFVNAAKEKISEKVNPNSIMK